MKTNMFKIGRCALALSLSLVMAAPIAMMTSCKENISEDAYAIASKQTISDYLASKEELSDIKVIFDEVRLGYSENASVLSSVLSARGNYTVFAPTNSAIAHYVDSVTDGKSSAIADLSTDEKERIALNCIIDNGTDNAYELSDFPSNGAFALSNLRDRRMTCRQNENNDYVINNQAAVVESNLEASNGMLHVVDNVIVPSDASVAELVQRADNMRIMGQLLAETGWADSLSLKTEAEREYEIAYQSQAGTVKSVFGGADQIANVPFMDKRAVGYTAFIETDEVLNADWGIPMPDVDAETGTIRNWETIKAEILARCESIYGSEASDDLTHARNAINRFVAYHLLDGKMAMEDRDCVHHFNEFNFDIGGDPKNPKSNYSVNVWDYYTTKCRYVNGSAYGRALLKITQLAVGENDFYLNRISTYDDGFDGNYQELNSVPNAVSRDGRGTNGLNIKISKTNGDYDNNASNGFYFPIEHVLVNATETQQALGSERIRIDVTTMLPEILSNSLRGKGFAYFPTGYFTNIMNESTGTEISYLQNGYSSNTAGWKDYQGDELLIIGQYDFVLKLPPVPQTGSYELRMGVSNHNLRSMLQVYIGESPYDMVPIGLPIDQREVVSNIPGNPWVADEDNNNDELACRESDRNLRNQGYMKGPNYFCKTQFSGRHTTTVRNVDGNNQYDGPALRRILTTQTFDKDKTYYLRFKSAISESKVECFIDYFEFVPSSVYADDSNPEDIW